MALPQRVFSLETEYAINFFGVGGSGSPPELAIVKALQEAITPRYGLLGSLFLTNGGKLHHDLGHAEWSLPECRSAYEATVYSKVADQVLGQAATEATAIINRAGFRGELLVIKNNVDSQGVTYGCHENYQTLRTLDLLPETADGQNFLRYLVRCLVPFLVSRQLLVGAGRLIYSERPAPELRFEIAQRARFIDRVVSKETTKERPIVNLGRESEPHAGGNARRLHLILGDANLSGWATWIKLGTTGLLLRMAEDLYLSDLPLLRDPVAALHAIAADPSCTQLVPLHDGRQVSALDLQWLFYEQAYDYLEQFGSDADEQRLMEAWGEALQQLDADPALLRDRVDWVAKRQLLETSLREHGIGFEEAARHPETIRALQHIDLLYHDIGPAGLFTQLWPIDTLVRAAEVEAAKQRPPFSRALLRGAAIEFGRRGLGTVGVQEWSRLTIDAESVLLSAPLAFDLASLPPAVRTIVSPWLADGLRHPDSMVRRLALQAMHVAEPGQLTLLAEIVASDPSRDVRVAAVQALGASGDAAAVELLLPLLGADDPVLLWAAEEALSRLTQALPGERLASPVVAADLREGMVQMIG
jgi:proteasome accessory factor A